MINIITDEHIEHIEILSELTLSRKEREIAKEDIGRMLDLVDKLNELDTEGVEPMTHVLPINNVFRNDVMTNADMHDSMMKNAPVSKEGAYVVPKTIVQ